jgi:hypothetical protein
LDIVSEHFFTFQIDRCGGNHLAVVAVQDAQLAIQFSMISHLVFEQHLPTTQLFQTTKIFSVNFCVTLD